MVNPIYYQLTTPQTLTLQQNIMELQKAMAVQYLGALGQFPGPGEVGVQSLESEFYILTYGDSEFKGLADIEPVPVTSLVHQYQLLTQYGSDIPAAVGMAALPGINQSFYQRGYAEVRFFADLRQLPLPMLQIESSVGNLVARYTADSLYALAGKVEHEIWHGDSDVNPFTFDGLKKQIKNFIQNPAYGQFVQAPNIVDARGGYLTPALLEQAVEIVRMNWGPTNNLRLHASPAALQPLATNFLGNQRVIPSLWNGGAGNRFSRWDAQFGTILMRDNRFTEKAPFNPLPKTSSQNFGIGPNGPVNPTAAPTVTVNTTDPASQWVSGSSYSPPGYYSYCYEYINPGGVSLASPISAPQNIPAGGSATLSIPINVSPAVTGIRIYRNATPYSSASVTPQYSDMQMVGDYPVGSQVGTFTWTDENADLPGTYDVFLLNPNKGAVHMGRLGDVKKYDLAPITMAQWFFTAFFGMLIVPAPQWHVWIKNVQGATLPTVAVPAAY